MKRMSTLCVVLLLIAWYATGQSIPAKAQGNANTYFVKKGETLAMIAKKFNTTSESIVVVNSIADPNRIEIGQKLFVPSWDVNAVTEIHRESFAKIYERGMQGRGHPTIVTLEGPRGTTLRMTWSLVTRSVADDIMDSDSKANLRCWGFQTVIIDNGSGQTYDYKLIEKTRKLPKYQKKKLSKFSNAEGKRIELARSMDDEMGSEATITAEGKGHKTLRYETWAMDKNFAHSIYLAVDEKRVLAKAGFEGLICSDGGGFEVFWRLF